MTCSFPVARTLLQNMTNPNLLASQIPIAPPAPNLCTPHAKVIVQAGRFDQGMHISQLLGQALDQAAAHTRLSPAHEPLPLPRSAEGLFGSSVQLETSHTHFAAKQEPTVAKKQNKTKHKPRRWLSKPTALSGHPALPYKKGEKTGPRSHSGKERTALFPRQPRLNRDKHYSF